MEASKIKNGGGLGFIRSLCFIAFGTTIFTNPMDRFNLYYIGFGVIICLIFGWLFKKFLRGLLALFNPNLKKECGKKIIFRAVDIGMLFLIPFAVMSLLAAFFLNWSITGGFISTGIIAAGTASAIEIGKLKDKKAIKDTIVTSGVSYLFSFLLTISIQILVQAPGLIEGAAQLIPTLFSKGGGTL